MEHLTDKLIAGANRYLPKELEYMKGPLRGVYLRHMARWTLRERIDVHNFDFLRDGMLRFIQFQKKHEPKEKAK